MEDLPGHNHAWLCLGCRSKAEPLVRDYLLNKGSKTVF